MATNAAKGSRAGRQVRLVTGGGSYVDDISFPGMLHMGVVRSPHAHARVQSVDLSAAREIEGVVETLELEELMRETAPLPLGTESYLSSQFPGSKSSTTYALARDVARYVGEPVAAIVCERPEVCRDAVDAAQVDYEALPAVANVEDALGPTSPLVYREWGTNVMFERRLTKGDVGRGFKEATAVVETRLEIARQVSGAIEPRGVVVQYDGASGRWTIHSQTKTPFQTKEQLATILKVDPGRIDVIAVDVGGNFGIKGRTYPEDVLACLLAKKTGRPVKWIATRNEDLLSSWQGRGQLHKVKVGLDSQGRILALEDEFSVDVGSYWLFNLAAMRHAFGLSTGGYRIPNLRLDGRAVVTNKVPFGTVRGNGRPEAIFVIERVLDIVARELRKDPLEVRLANILGPEELPYDTGTGTVLDGGDYARSIQLLKRVSNYESLREMQRSRRSEGALMGIGVASYVEDTGGGSETAELSLQADGRLRLVSGSSPSGQGIEHVLSQIVADQFGVSASDLDVVCGDTTLIPDGSGTFGSRSAVLAGSAARIAAERLKRKVGEFASSDGRGAREQWLDLPAIAREAERHGALESLREFVKFSSEASTYSFGAHLAVVEVDRESFEVRLVRYFAVDDAGRVLNRANVEGQVIGGIANGLGNALLENFAFNADGQPISPTFADYLLPAPTDMPMVETLITETPSMTNPLGARGVGEGGTIGGLAAIVNAVEDAVSHLGIRITSVPANQSKIWALEGRRDRRGDQVDLPGASPRASRPT